MLFSTPAPRIRVVAASVTAQRVLREPECATTVLRLFGR